MLRRPSPRNRRPLPASVLIWGNLLTITFPSAQYNTSCAQPDSMNFGVSTNNQISSPSGYVYDLAGNLTTTPNPGGASYSYNAENQLKTTASVNYIYDGDGKRIEKDNGKLFWYGTSSDVLEETSLTGALTNDYVFLGGQRVARRDSSGNIFAYFADHLGSSRKVEEIASGGSTASLSYDADFYPFGRAHEFVNTSDPIHKFTGKERDTESGLDNFGARYNSYILGRFMSADPDNAGADQTDPQSWNAYAYVQNNPLTFIDPTGMECVWDDGSFDAEDDAQTGSADSCQDAGGTWIELGQNGAWSDKPDSDLQSLVADIHSLPPFEGFQVTITNPDGSQYQTDYNSYGQVTRTITPSGSTLYGSGEPSSLSRAGFGLALVGEGACIILEPCGAGEGAGAAIFGGLFLVSQGVIDLSRHFAKGGKQNIVSSWAEGERPLPGESARDFAKRLCDARYGAGNYNTGPGSEFSKIQKWARDKFGI